MAHSSNPIPHLGYLPEKSLWRRYWFNEVDVSKLASIEATLEEILSRNNYSGNVMVQHLPLRIEVSKPKNELPLFALEQVFHELEHFPTNQGVVVPAMSFANGSTGLYDLRLVNDNRSALVVGKPGSGKSQLALSLLLTMCYLNSPDYLSLIIADPKADDYLPLEGLKNLAMPVITEAERLLEVLEILVAEMDSRRDRGLRGDRTYKNHLIAIYVDELADVQASLKGEEKQRFITAWQRLAQRGRSAGFIIIGATQRPYDLDGSLYANLNLKFVGALNSANESAALVGKGVVTNKLAPGSFEVYPKGDSIRGLFVADANLDTYEAIVKTFVQRINKRWGNVAPHFSLAARTEATDGLVSKLEGLETDGENVVIDGSKFPVEFLQRIIKLDETDLSKYQIGKVYSEMYDKELSPKRKTIVHDFVVSR